MSETQRHVAIVALLCLTTLLVFLPLRTAEFLRLDDAAYVTENPHISKGLTWEGIRWAATDTSGNWHPLTWLSHMVDCHLFGLDAGAHHLSAVLWHIGNSALLWYTLLRLTGALWPSTVVAALFALHPLHVESVAWVSERKDLLCAGFWFATILAYRRYVERRTLARYALVCVCMALGLLSKGMIITLPVTLLLLDYWPLRRWPAAPSLAGTWVLLREKLPLAAISLIGLTVQFMAHWSEGALRSLDDVPFGLRLANSLLSYARYAGKMLWPVNLAFPYPLPPHLPPAWQIAGAVLWLAGVSAVVARWGREHRYLVTGWLWYLVTLFPVIGLVQFGPQALADRYTYVPLIGLFVAIAWGAAESARRHPALRSTLAGLAILVVVLCMGLTRRQVGYWQDGITLFRHTLDLTTDNTNGEVYLAAAYAAKGMNELAEAHYTAALRITPGSQIIRDALALLLLYEGRFAEAEPHLLELQRAMPAYAPVRMNLGIARMQQGDAAGAREHFRAVIELDPGNAVAHYRLGQAFEAERQFAEALAAYERAAQLDPTLPGLHDRLARRFAAAGRLPEAVAEYREAVRRDPNDGDAENELGALLQETGQREEARQHFAAALRINPADAEAHNNLGVLLFEDGETAAAEEHLREALRLKPNYAGAHTNLGMIRLHQGDAPTAAEHFRAALTLEPDNAGARDGLAQALAAARPGNNR